MYVNVGFSKISFNGFKNDIERIKRRVFCIIMSFFQN